MWSLTQVLQCKGDMTAPEVNLLVGRAAESQTVGVFDTTVLESVFKFYQSDGTIFFSYTNCIQLFGIVLISGTH